MRLGVLDVGSNTVHMLVVDAHRGAAPIPMLSHKDELRLSEFITDGGAIEDAGVERLMDFVIEARGLAEEQGVEEIFAFATSAIRDSSNGEVVLERLRAASGVAVNIMSGPDEARSTFLAVRRWFGWSSGKLLVLDIGGGSLEIASGADEDPEVAVSLPLGAGRLTRLFDPRDIATKDDLKSMRKYVRSELESVADTILATGPWGHAVATSKSFKQLARITGAAPSSLGPFVPRLLHRDDLQAWVPLLGEMSVEERASLPGVSNGRARQVLAAAVVADALVDILDLEVLEICPWALREGVILRYLDGMANAS